MNIVRRLLWYGFLSLPVLLLITLLFWRPIAVFLLHDLPFIGSSFDKATWDNALKCATNAQCMEVELACIRGPMVRDLTRNHLPPGTGKQDVMRLLGDVAPVKREPTCLDYSLGMCSGFRIDYDWLRICFDQDEKMTSVRHYQS